MFGLQKLFYGPLRPIEVEQLYEKAWFAITETCLAMTIFREEVGGWFLVMFVCLLIGKVWGWIGEGRVEVLEQQPPPNPRLFHARLSVSLIISTLFNISMLRYSINTVLLHARPNMMVMFAFEFAVLTVTSLSTAARYTISLHEASVTSNQIKDRRAQMRRDREHARSHAPSTDSSTPPGTHTEDAAPEDDIDSLDIDVPGWEEKGRWVFYLDLTTGKVPAPEVPGSFPLTSTIQTSSNWSYTSPSSACFACSMACPFTSSVMLFSQSARSTSGSRTSSAIDRQRAI